MELRRNQPIGVFDSGIGGLTIVRELMQVMPNERILYFGDDANCPYGPRPESEVQILSLAATAWLVNHEAKAIVVACNAASVSAREILRATYPDIPIIVVVPAVKPAAAISHTRKIILAATARAINDRFTCGLIDTYADGVTVISVACPSLVAFVEAGLFDGPEVETALRDYLQPALAEGADVVVLGCTHFPALRNAVERVVGPNITVIDSGEAVAQQTQRVLQQQHLLADTATQPLTFSMQLQCWTSGDAEHFSHVASSVLGSPVIARHIDHNPFGVAE